MTAETWTCHARPATKGSACGHVNTTGGFQIVFDGRLVEHCMACGCTKAASDARAAKAARKAVTP